MPIMIFSPVANFGNHPLVFPYMFFRKEPNVCAKHIFSIYPAFDNSQTILKANCVEFNSSKKPKKKNCLISAQNGQKI